jgi:hypothetical protein
MTSQDRIEQFKSEVADLKLKTSTGGAEQAAGKAGIIFMVLAVIVGFGAYIQSTSAENALDQSELVILALACVALAVFGAALYISTKVITFWRFWMLRQMYEHQAHLDQLVERLGHPADSPSPVG